MIDHGAVLDDEPVLGALEVDGHLLDRGDHDDKGVALMLALTLSDTGTGHGCLHNWPRWLTAHTAPTLDGKAPGFTPSPDCC